MKNKKIIVIITAILLFAFVFCLSSCSDKNNSEPAINNETDESLNSSNTSASLNPSTEPINITELSTEPTTPEPLEIWQVPALPADSAAANIKDISSGNVFDASFRRGINMGNMLEAPEEGAWGVYFDPEFFKLIKQRGFDFVRIPVGWSNHFVIKSTTGEISLSKDFRDRVKYIVDEALLNGLGVIINIHHFNEIFTDAENNVEKLYMIWRTVSEQYQNYPANVVFEILNEPNGQLTTKVWNEYQNECIKIIRETNPTRKIVVSAGDWGGITGITDLVLPEDENLILSFHCYDPFNFTHQGADWTGSDMNKYLGTQWTGSDFEKRSLENTFRAVKAWSEASGLPVLMGEFGAYSKADMESRVRWTSYMRETAERYGFAWSYWEFCSGFGIYDQQTGEFNDIANALTGTPIDASTYGTGTGMPKMSADRGTGYIGPFKIERNINIVCDSWTGMSMYDTDNNTQIIELGGANTADWAQAYIILNGLTDTGSGFSYNTCELTVRNIDNSITDFCINLDNGTELETTLLWMNKKQLTGSSKEVIQNADGTTTFVLNLQKAYSTFKGKCEDKTMRLKMFIESVPDRSKNYDREGKMEFIKVELK